MTSADIAAALEQQFGDRITSKNLTALDPWVAVAPPDLLEVCRFLKNDPRRLSRTRPQKSAQGRL
jgi:NADH-quinone oxidoreductase subunit C